MGVVVACSRSEGIISNEGEDRRSVAMEIVQLSPLTNIDTLTSIIS